MTTTQLPCSCCSTTFISSLFIAAGLLSACTKPAPAKMEKPAYYIMYESENLSIGANIEDLRDYLRSLGYPDLQNVRGTTMVEREASQTALINSYAKTLASNGISRRKLSNFFRDDANVRLVLDKFFSGGNQFDDYVNLSEIAVLARTKNPPKDTPITFSGPAYFELEIVKNLLNTELPEKLSVRNAIGSHDRILVSGQECVFFLSPTRTEYLKLFKSDDDLSNLPPTVFVDYFPSFCSSDGTVFQAHTQIGGEKVVTRTHILTRTPLSP